VRHSPGDGFRALDPSGFPLSEPLPLYAAARAFNRDHAVRLHAVKPKSQRSLLIRDCRLFTGRFRLHGESELPRDAVSVVMTELHVMPGSCAFQSFPAITAQFHSLARYFQRSFTPTEEGLRTDLARMARAYPAAVEQAERSGTRKFHIDGWRGELHWQHSASVDSSLSLVVRTYLPDGLIRAAA
jgi:hypothetical protein